VLVNWWDIAGASLYAGTYAALFLFLAWLNFRRKRLTT
jgi:hypothetical protein